MATGKKSKYGCLWPESATDLQIEFAAIRLGGTWEKNGQSHGKGLPYHYEQARKILWPHLDDHRWHKLALHEIVQNKVTVLMGPGSCGKTHEAAWFFLVDYYVFPQETCVLVSSTDIRGLELRVWGEIKTLHEYAQQFHDVPGILIDSKHAITTDDIEEESVRDLRKGIIGIPCVQNGKFVGIGKYCGIKQKRMRLVADEAQFMGATFLSAFSNLDKNVDFKAVVLGNPNDMLDPLGKAAEPKAGWGSQLEPTKTTVWNTRFMNGRCINFVGTDSPNFDYPEDQITRFPYLISREKIANTLSFFPKDSVEYYSQCLGVMKIGQLSRRVITRTLCEKFDALRSEITWSDQARVRIGGLDAAYGGDRCVTGHIEFGRDITGKTVLQIFRPVIVPIRVSAGREPEDQIAEFVRDYCQQHNIEAFNFFHDSTGRGSLGTSLARIWSSACNPIEFGGNPTRRPVSLDLRIYDEKERRMRLKRCDEHYSKFVTELWFAIRYAIESGQIAGLPEDVMEEGSMREWRIVNGDKREIETKEKMKIRVGRSPDLFDWLAVCVEGARRRGFMVAKLGAERDREADLELRRKLGPLAETHVMHNLKEEAA